MSGTGRLIGEEIELLADNPIIGPLPTDIVVSVDGTVRLGYNPGTFQVGPIAAQVIAANSSALLTLDTAITSTPYLSSSILYQAQPSSSIVGNVLTLNAKGFKGSAFVQLYAESSIAVAPAFPETVGIIVQIYEDGLVVNSFASHYPMIKLTPNNQFYSFECPINIPYNATRISVGFSVSVLNQQAANTLTIKNNSVLLLSQNQ